MLSKAPPHFPRSPDNQVQRKRAIDTARYVQRLLNVSLVVGHDDE